MLYTTWSSIWVIRLDYWQFENKFCVLKINIYCVSDFTLYPPYTSQKMYNFLPRVIRQSIYEKKYEEN